MSWQLQLSAGDQLGDPLSDSRTGDPEVIGNLLLACLFVCQLVGNEIGFLDRLAGNLLLLSGNLRRLANDFRRLLCNQ